MTSHRLLSSTERKNHNCHCMTSDAALDFSSCPDNTPTIGLHLFQGTKGLDLVRVFYVATLLQIIKSALAPYSYPGFCNTWLPSVVTTHGNHRRVKPQSHHRRVVTTDGNHGRMETTESPWEGGNHAWEPQEDGNHRVTMGMWKPQKGGNHRW